MESRTWKTRLAPEIRFLRVPNRSWQVAHFVADDAAALQTKGLGEQHQTAGGVSPIGRSGGIRSEGHDERSSTWIRFSIQLLNFWEMCRKVCIGGWAGGRAIVRLLGEKSGGQVVSTAELDCKSHVAGL